MSKKGKPVPDLSMIGYQKVWIKRLVIDGGPLRDEWGYKFQWLDSETSITEYLIPSISEDGFFIATLQFTFSRKNKIPVINIRSSKIHDEDSNDWDFANQKTYEVNDILVNNSRYKIYEFCLQIGNTDTIQQSRTHKGKVFYNDLYGVYFSYHAFPGFSLELSNHNGGRILKRIKKEIWDGFYARNTCI